MKCPKHGYVGEPCSNCEDDMKRWIKNSNIPLRFLNASFENFKTTPESSKMVSDLAAYKFDRNIVMLGQTGTGKTHLACALMNKCRDYAGAYYVQFYRLGDLKIHDFNLFTSVVKRSFLVIDEFGVSDNDFKSNMLYEVINDRYNMGLPTMIISNLTAGAFKQSISDALYSRLKGDALSIVSIGEDYRLRGAA